MYSYGTAGFRYHSSIMEQIASKIGKALAILSVENQKSYGIMITASHNAHCDNGVKIMNENGCMVSSEEELLLEKYVNFPPSSIIYSSLIPILTFGYDTRKSSIDIQKLMIDEIKICFPGAIIKIHDYPVTTPELHFEMASPENNYVEFVANQVQNITYPVVVDCANGVGALTLKKILEKTNQKNVILDNIQVEEYESLNFFCGSDYVCNNFSSLDVKNYIKNTLYASFDGDADRIVFYCRFQDQMYLMDGDKISALICHYIMERKSDNCNVGLVYTAYSNSKFLDSLHKKIDKRCAATGVKNLHHEAEKFDIGVYFESNGHGTALFKKPMNGLEKWFHPTIGDSIMDLFAVLHILEELNWTPYRWSQMFINDPYLTIKCKVANKKVFKTNWNETRIIEPLELQDFLDKQPGFAFVRPSGTEDVIRIHIEADNNEKVEKIKENVLQFVKSKYMFEVRDACEEDYKKNHLFLYKQLTSIDPLQITREEYGTFINNNTIRVIEHEGKIIGGLTVLVEEKLIHNMGKVAHIEDVVVDKEYRSHGLGKLLIQDGIKIANREKCYKIILDCEEKNVGFYEKCGFEKKGIQMAKYI